MTEKLSLRDLDVKGKKVLIRVDFNVPMEHGKITDDTRIRASLPTIQYVLDHGGAAIIMSHLGRPRGNPDPKLSLAPCAKRLSEFIKKPVKMARDCCGAEVEKMAQGLSDGGILVLENLRFHKGEEHPDEEPTFASALAELGDLYVDDAFGCAHRSHASIAAITQFFPDRSAEGFLLEKEVAYLGKALDHPKRPFCAILGGSKISTKFKVIESLMQKADVLLIGGAMAFTFFKAENLRVGNSLVEDDFLGVARELIDVSTQSRCKIMLPADIVIAQNIDSKGGERVVKIQDGIPDGFQGFDLGPETIRLYAKELSQASTVFWNGPLGVFESPPFDKGTNEIAKILADLNATTIIGGGDTVAAVEKAGLATSMSHISTGGGAALEYIEFGKLPGIEALSDKSRSFS